MVTRDEVSLLGDDSSPRYVLFFVTNKRTHRLVVSLHPEMRTLRLVVFLFTRDEDSSPRYVPFFIPRRGPAGGTTEVHPGTSRRDHGGTPRDQQEGHPEVPRDQQEGHPEVPRRVLKTPRRYPGGS